MVEHALQDLQVFSSHGLAAAADELSPAVQNGDTAPVADPDLAGNLLSGGHAPQPGWGPVETLDSPDVVIAKQLLDHARLCGFTFQRTAPGADAPLVGHRVSDDWVDLIRIEGFSRDCSAWREWTSSLIVSEDEFGQRQHRVQGSAVHVLNEVLTWDFAP